MAHRLDTVISDALWQALHDRAASSGQSIRALIQSALAESLDIEHHSMFQISTSGAIVQGLYQGALTVGDLRRHGDTGLGTFEDLDGELILVDGHCYQARSDGSVVEVPDAASTPFATVVAFAADHTEDFSNVTSHDDLTQRLDTLRSTDNDFFAWRITGICSQLRVRTACQHASGTPLVEAVADQAVFEFAEIPITMVGFWSPAFAEAVAIPGYHLHAISDDRAHGGHVFDLSAERLLVAMHRVSDLHLALPETREFLEAHLSDATSVALDRTEHGG
ncbi:MAG: acetolactate decarboxylase [Candidatus Nanopelagicales bacterium]